MAKETINQKAIRLVRERMKEMHQGKAHELLTIREIAKKIGRTLGVTNQIFEDEGININIGIQLSGGGGHYQEESIGEYRPEDLKYWETLDKESKQ